DELVRVLAFRYGNHIYIRTRLEQLFTERHLGILPRFIAVEHERDVRCQTVQCTDVFFTECSSHQSDNILDVSHLHLDNIQMPFHQYDFILLPYILACITQVIQKLPFLEYRRLRCIEVFRLSAVKAAGGIADDIAMMIAYRY